MTLEQQIDQLIHQAPDYGVSLVVMQQGIAPVLRRLARSLQHEQYYILRSPSEQWVMTTLSDRLEPLISKKVLYAFADQVSAQNFPDQARQGLTPHLMPVTHLLFQLLALKPLESLLLYEQPLPTQQIQEIKRNEFTAAIQESLQKFKSRRSHLA